MREWARRSGGASALDRGPLGGRLRTSPPRETGQRRFCERSGIVDAGRTRPASFDGTSPRSAIRQEHAWLVAEADYQVPVGVPGHARVYAEAILRAGDTLDWQTAGSPVADLICWSDQPRNATNDLCLVEVPLGLLPDTL